MATVNPASDSRNRLSDPQTWVEQHGDALYRYAMTRVRDQSIAEDVVQDALLAALENRDRFSGHSDERTWLISILKHKIIDHFRRTSREAINDIDPIELVEDPDFRQSSNRRGTWKAGARPEDWSVAPDNSLENKEFREFFQRCLDHLPPHLAVIFVLREMEELSAEKICNVLNLTATNLRVMIYRARKGLRKCLEVSWLGETAGKR